MSVAHNATATQEPPAQDAESNKNEEISTMITEASSILDSPSPDPCPEQDGASDETIATTLKESSVLGPPASGPQETFNFVRQKKGWIPKDQYRLKNSLLAGVGLLEFGNALDFPSNVWNQIPVPRFAVVLMAIGGTVALAISLFAFRDAYLSRQNIRNLRAERRFLWSLKPDPGAKISRDVDSQLDINFRELGTEYVDRLGMDIAMGFGSVMVSSGTFLAIGGANPRVYRASNLMSGYIGNAPVALYGLGNAAFSVYVWRRANHHGVAAAREMKSAAFNRRIWRVKTHAAVNAVSGITAGAGSLVTATLWEGYPVLIPCIISAIVCNYLWRNRIAYERPLVRQKPDLDKTSLIEELEHITSVREILKTTPPADWFSKLIPDPSSLPSILEFLRTNDLFGDFCSRLLMDETLATTILGPLEQEVMIDEQTILAADKELYPRIMKIGEDTLRKMGSIRFKYRERYVLEILGCYLCSEGRAKAAEKC